MLGYKEEEEARKDNVSEFGQEKDLIRNWVDRLKCLGCTESPKRPARAVYGLVGYGHVLSQ